MWCPQRGVKPFKLTSQTHHHAIFENNQAGGLAEREMPGNSPAPLPPLPRRHRVIFTDNSPLLDIRPLPPMPCF
jgi:hypothetical protein